MELDALDRKAAESFDGYIVRKDLVRKYARQYPVPTYVVEFLLGRYCATVDEAAVRSALESVLAKFKIPKRVLVKDALPRNAMGKVQKNVLRDTHAGLYAGAAKG